MHKSQVQAISIISVLVITYSNSTHTDMLITDMSIDPSGKSNAWKNVFGGLTLTGAFGHYFPTKKLILYCGGENERSWEAYSDCRKDISQKIFFEKLIFFN